MNVADQFKQYEYFWQTDPNTGAVWLDQCAVIGDEIEIPHQGGVRMNLSGLLAFVFLILP